MSRIGKLPIKIPANVDITFNGNDITVKGKFGILQKISLWHSNIGWSFFFQFCK